MYEVGTSTGFSAQHVMPGVEGPEGTPHSHDYRLDVVVQRAELDDRGMVCDLDVLDAALAQLHDKVAGQDLEQIRPPEAEAVTVEVFARWSHGFLAERLGGSGADQLQVRVWESATAFGGFAAAL